MAYKKQVFEDNKTVLSSTHLNHIEDGIVAIENALIGDSISSLFIKAGRGISINGETENNNSNGNQEEDIFGGLLHYLLNVNADTNGQLVTYSGRMTIGEWIPTNGKQLTVTYDNDRLTSYAVRYVDEERKNAVSYEESAYARIVFYKGTDSSTLTSDIVDETTVTINGNNYALMTGVLEDYINDACLENLNNTETDGDSNEENDSTNDTISDTTISINDILVSTTEDYVMQIFEKIVCIGDSLTAGFTNKNGTTFGSNKTRPTKRNWPGYLGKRLNTDVTNLGYGSTTTRSWRYANDNLGADIKLATSITDADCYIVSLGYNDRGKFSVGSTSDIKTDKEENLDTFYGNYDYIIRSLLDVNSIAQVFLMTAPHPVESSHAINTAIRTISQLYPNRVHLIDLSENYNNFFKEGIIADTWNGHMFPLTYQLTSMIIQKAISSYMLTNYSKFYGVPWTGN